MKTKWALLTLLGLLGTHTIEAKPAPTVAQATHQLNQLQVEYRVRVRAVDLLSEMTLFDETGMLGRNIAGGQFDVLVGEGSVGPSRVGGFESRPVPDLHTGADLQPMAQLEREIEELRKEIARLKKKAHVKP